MARLYVPANLFFTKKCKMDKAIKENFRKRDLRQTFSNGINRACFWLSVLCLICFDCFLEGKFYQDEFSDNFVSNVKSMLN